MAFTQSRIKQAKSRILAGHIIEILYTHGLLQTVYYAKMEDWNGKNVMVSKLEALSPEEQEGLEKEILYQIETYLK